MVLDIGISDVLSITQTIGIIGTLLLALYFSRREIRELSVDVETKVLSDLDEKIHRLEEHLLERPEISRIIYNVQSLSADLTLRTSVG
ncbi:MAG: hypothetical protein WAK17_15765 [Candidatus Nitrosopolaris sp.]|jgi:hypothetical protein